MLPYFLAGYDSEPALESLMRMLKKLEASAKIYLIPF